MLQTHIPHPADRFRPCARCSHQPKHYTSTGRSTRETVSIWAPHIERHHLECPRCQVWTPLSASLRTSVIDWNATHAAKAAKQAA